MPSVKEFLLEQHWEATLASLFEMLQYQSPLLCAPNAFACLACTKSERYDLHDVQTKVLKALKTEWEMLLCLEQDAEGSVLLHRLCPQTTWQSYRELMVTFERESWQLTPWSVDMVLAWFPQVNCSSNIEDSFNTMQDACNRGGKSGVSSMANLQALHIRSVTQKMTGKSFQPASVELTTEDWEGPEVRGLKPKMFQPSTFQGSSSEEGVVVHPICCRLWQPEPHRLQVGEWWNSREFLIIGQRFSFLPKLLHESRPCMKPVIEADGCLTS